MAHYFIAQIKITDENEYKKYICNCEDVFSQFNGKYLIVDNNPQVIEGDWDYTRMVIIEFDTEEELKRWYYSAEYQEILEFRLSSARCDTIITKGL